MRKAVAILGLGLAAALVPACQGGFGAIGQGKRLAVIVTDGDPGSADKPRFVSTSEPTTFTVTIEAHNPDGSLDPTFDGYVAVSVQPGTVSKLDSRNVRLKAGVYEGLQVPVIGVFGDAHIVAQDLGYQPASPDRVPPPQCSDGIDNNHNGLIDYPADPGCYAPVDDSEDLGTYASGLSETLHFSLPRISLVRGYDPKAYGNGNATAFPQQQISIDTGWKGGIDYSFRDPATGAERKCEPCDHGDPACLAGTYCGVVVTGLTADGFYVQDLQTDLTSPPGFGGIFAYNYATPAFMRVCDRVQLLGGTSSDFYGFTEMNYPAWQLEYWNDQVRPCLVPEPTELGPLDINDEQRMWQVEATLVRTLTSGTTEVHVAKHFGPGNVPRDDAHCLTGQTPPCYVPDETHSNCDFNHTGKIDFSDPNEAACAAACGGGCSAASLDFECSEWSNWVKQTEFTLVVTDTRNACKSQSDCASGYVCSAVSATESACVSKARISANAASAGKFSPTAERGQTIHSFTGLLRYFSGGCSFTTQARCDDDVVADMHADPKTSNVACVHPRTLSDINAASP